MDQVRRGANVMSHGVLLVIGIFQLAFIVGILWLLFMTDGRLRTRDQKDALAPLLLRQPLADFLVNGKGVEGIALELARMPRHTAARQMERIGATILAREQLSQLAECVRRDPWVATTLAGGESRHWWKRLDAARLLPMVYRPQDRALLARLVMDKHAAVAAAAAAGLAAHADDDLVALVVGRLASTRRTLRLQQMQGLRAHSAIASRLLVAALARDLSPEETRAMVELAEVIATPAALAAVVRVAGHPSAGVRAAVARALRAAFVDGASQAAQTLLQDPDWQVRAAAARAVEGLRVTNAVKVLRDALRDDEWWVRFRAAGALASLGEPGSIALEEAVVSDDVYASEMAIAVGGLSEANLLDISG